MFVALEETIEDVEAIPQVRGMTTSGSLRWQQALPGDGQA